MRLRGFVRGRHDLDISVNQIKQILEILAGCFKDKRECFICREFSYMLSDGHSLVRIFEVCAPRDQSISHAARPSDS